LELAALEARFIGLRAEMKDVNRLEGRAIQFHRNRTFGPTVVGGSPALEFGGVA
jgi:hypothetical protein